MSRLYIHEARSKETCGMSCSHILYCLEHMVVEEAHTLPNSRSRFDSSLPSFTWWPGGMGCQPDDCNTPGHSLKLLGGKGTGGADAFTRGQKMAECAVLSRFCHMPVNSYLSGSSDIDLRGVRYLFNICLLFFIRASLTTHVF